MLVANLPEGISLGPSGGLVVAWAPEGSAAAATHAIERLPLVLPGECCRVCGCTFDRPCFIANEQIEGDGRLLTCSWVDANHTLCSNPKCVAEIPLAELEALCSAD